MNDRVTRNLIYLLIICVAVLTFSICQAQNNQPSATPEFQGRIKGPISAFTAGSDQSAVSANITFTDLALPMGIQDRLEHTRGIAIADWNGDGYPDLYLSNPGSPSVLNDQSFIMWNNGPDGSGNYTFTKGQVLITGELAYTPTAFDYDNDGDPDLFVGIGGVEGIGLDYLFRNDNGVFTDVSDLAKIRGPKDSSGNWVPTATTSAIPFDYDKDGCLDLFVSYKQDVASPKLHGNLGWRDSLFHSNCDGTFTDVSDAAGVGDTTSSQFSAVGDFDNDGWPDLLVPYWAMGGGSLGFQFYRNNHDGTFKKIAVDVGPLGTRSSWGAGVADFDNDGWLDAIVWAMGTSGNPDSHVLLMNHGNWTFTNEAANAGLIPPGVPVPEVMGCQIGDFNNDGYPDLVMGNGAPPQGQKDNLWLNTYSSASGLHFSDVSSLIDYPAAPDPSCHGSLCNPPYPYRGHGIALWDFDGDGDLDLFMMKGGPAIYSSVVEPNRAFRNDGGNSGNWLFVDLQGTVSNRDGVGARITAVANQAGTNQRKIYKEALAYSNFSSSGPHEIHIGLGNDDRVPQLVVSWPSGVQTKLSNVVINRRLELTEPAILASTFNDGQATGWKPQSGSWSVRNFAYTQQASHGSAISVNTTNNLVDFTVVGKLTYNSGAQAMALLGRTSSNGKTTYGVVLQASHAQLFKSINGVLTLLGKAIPIDAMTAGKSYIVSLTMKGSKLQMSVDGTVASAVTDSSITQGYVGVMTNGTVATFDNIISY